MGATPLTTAPVEENTDPWHGHKNCLVFFAYDTRQPWWVQAEEKALNTPLEGCRTMPLTGALIPLEGIGAEKVADPPTGTLVVFPMALPSELV